MPSKKSVKQRNNDRMKNKEYSKSYLEQKRKQEERDNIYPFTRMILIRDVFKSSDLYKAIFLFIAAQVIIITIAAGVQNENIAGALNLLALIIGVVLVITAIRMINYRQSLDHTRRRVSIATIVLTLISMYLLLIGASWAYGELGIEIAAQPNQSSIDTLSLQFPIAMIFTIVIVSPIIEELVFRELLPYATGPSYISFVIASLIFIALHAPFGLMGWTSYGILAAGFLFARLKDNNVYTAIIVHIIWNATSVLL